MITAAERRAKIEKLRKDREAKEKERQERLAKQAEEARNQTSSNTLINTILAHNTEANEHLTATQSIAQTGQVQANAQKAAKPPLRVASHVVELEIFGIKPPVTYDKEIMCDIPDPKAARLQRISEDGEYDDWQDDFENRFESVQRTMQDTRQSRRSSQLGGSQYRTNQLESQKNRNEQKDEEIKITEMPKAEAEVVIKTPDFQGFFENSSRLIERALGQEFNLMEEFFAEEDENKDKDRLEKGSKL